MRKTLCPVRVVSLCMIVVAGWAVVRAAAQEQPPRSPDEFVKQQLKTQDKDGDGKISRDEAGPLLTQFFDRVDADGDGYVDAKELKAAAERVAKRLARRGGAAKPAPTCANVKYGPHERNVLDFWKAKSKEADSKEPTPLVIFIHGGGFRNGSKEVLNPMDLRRLLDAGISVAALNYRFVSQAPLPAAHHDCRRALQFLRSKAGEWNIDKTRAGAFGGSAGAQLSMYLAFHDEMAKPDSADPIERESTRLACVATMGGQTTMDLSWWKEHVPGFDAPQREASEVFGTTVVEEYRKKAADISALSLISKDDPPIFMTYAMKPDAPVPDDPGRAWGWKVHHVAFGVALKEKMDALGVEADLQYPGAKTKYGSIPEFLIAKLKPGESRQQRATRSGQ